MKRQGKSAVKNFVLKEAVIRLERCDAGARAAPKTTPRRAVLSPHVDLVDYLKMQEVGQRAQQPSVHKTRIKKRRKGKSSVTLIPNLPEKKLHAVTDSEACKDISSEVTDQDDTSSVAETVPVLVPVDKPCSLESSVAETCDDTDTASEACREISNIPTLCSEDADSAVIRLQDVNFSESRPVDFGSTSRDEVAEEEMILFETGDDDALTERVLKELTLAASFPGEFNIIEPCLDESIHFTTCNTIDNEMPLLVSEDMEGAVTLEDKMACPDAADPLRIFDHMPLLNVEGENSALFLTSDLPEPVNDGIGEPVEVFVVPDNCSAMFLCESASAMFTGLNNDVMLGDLGNRSSLPEEEELLATSGCMSVETATEESADFGENDFAVTELDWTCEQNWPLLDPIGSGFQVGQGSLNNSLDARDSDDEFEQKMREEFLARRLRYSSRLEDQENARHKSSKSVDQKSDSNFKQAGENSVITIADNKFDQKHPAAWSNPAKLKGKNVPKGKDSYSVVDIPQNGVSDLEHRPKPHKPRTKQRQVKFVDQKEVQVKPSKNFLLALNDKSSGDCPEESHLEKRPSARLKDGRRDDGDSCLPKTVLKSLDAVRSKYSEMKTKRKREIEMAADEKLKKLEKVAKVKNPCRDENCSSAAQPNSIFCGAECLDRHVQESLKLLAQERNKTLNNQNKLLGFSDAGKSAERIVVFERKTGKLITGPLAPTESSLLTWLQRHPTFEVLQPGNSSKNSKQKSSSSVMLKTSALGRPRPLSNNKEDLSQSVSYGVTLKGQKKEPVVKTKSRVLKTRSDSLSSSADQKTKQTKTDLEVLRTKIQLELCDLLLMRSEGEVSSAKVKTLASDVEQELWLASKSSSSVYKQKSLSIVRLFKRSSSQDLCNRLLCSELKPHQLVQDLARYFRTEIVSRNGTNDPTTTNHLGLLPGLTDTTDRHGNHVFDVGCRICTRRPVAAGDPEHSQKPASSSHLSVSNLSNGLLLPALDREKENSSAVTGLASGARRELISSEPRAEIVPRPHKASPTDVLPVCSPRAIPPTDHSKIFSVSFPPSVASAVGSHDVGAPRGAFSPGLTVAEKTETTSVSNSVDARPMVNPVVDSIGHGNSLQSPSHRPRLGSRTADESGEEFSVSGGQPLQKAPHDLSSPSSAVSKPVERSRSLSLASALESSTNLVWRGAISALDGAATMQAAAYRLSGSMSIVREVLPSTVTMMGRIAPQVVQQYLQKIREQHTATREIAIVCFRCHDSGEQVKYCQLFSYLQDKRRCGVVGSIGSLIKDMYIWPLPARTAIPTSILPSGDPGFESSRSNFLLGIIVQQARTNSAGSIKKPLVTTLPLDPLSSSQHSETDATTTQRLAENEIVRIEGATTNDESSEEDDDDDFKAIADSDPIVSKYSKVKRNDVSLKAPATCDEDDEDKPYDPYEAEYELNTIGQVKTKVANEEIAKPNQKVMSESAGAALTAFPPSPDDFTAGNKVENSPLESIARLTFNPDASTDVLLAKKSVESSGSVSVSCEVEHGAVSGGAPSPQVENSVSGTTASSHNSESEKLDVDVVVITDTDEKPEEESSTAAKSISGELNDGETTRLIPETGILSAAVSIECQENVFYNNINDLSSILNKCRENSVAASSDGKPDPKTPALGEVALSDVMTDSSSCQVVPFSESFEESSGGIIKSSDVKEAISELFHVDVLNEESLRKYLDQLMQSRGARTNVDQQKILVELIETVEKASDLANSRTNGNREFSDGSQCDRAESSTDEKTDSEQFGESRNSKLFEDQSSRAGDSATSAVGAHFSIPEDFTDDNNRETYQTDINSLKQKEIPSSSSPELLLETRFSLPNSREKALSYSEGAEDVGKQPVASSAASCSSLSCSWKSQTASEIPSDILNINIENILPILSSSSVETLKTIVMSAKSVQNIGHAASTACPNSVPCHTPPILSGPVSSCAPSSRFRPRVANISNSFPQNDSGGPQRRFPPAPRCPPLFNRVGFPEHVTGLGHRRPPAFGPVCESELRFRRLPRPNAVRHLNSLSASGRNPHLVRNQVPWQSHGMYGYYDDTVFHDGGARPRSFRNFSVGVAGRFPNENQPFQHFGRPSSGREVPPFSRENSCGEKSRGSSRDPQGNSDAGYGFLSNSVASESDVYSSSDSSNKNLNGESSSSPLFVVQGDSAYPRLDNGEVEGRGILFDSACFENNFSDNSYEFFGSASDDNLEEFLPHMVPLSAADCLGKSTDVDTSSDPVLETVGDADGFADGMVAAKIPESDDQLCLDEFTAERTIDAPRNDINLRHANIEMCRRIQSGTVSTSDYPEHSSYPHSSFADDDWFGDRGHSATAYLRHETGGDIGRMDMPGDRDHLYLRPNDRGGEIGSDLPEIRSLFSDPRGFRYYPDRPVTHSTDDGRSLERQQQSWQQDDGFSESRIHLGRDGYASGDQDGNTRLASSFQDSKNRRRKQNFSPNFGEDHVKRRRLDEISHGDEWGQHHRSIDPGDGYDLPPRSSNRYDNFFEPASYQNSVGSSDTIELSSGRFSRPQVIDYGHRKRDFVTERGHQDLYDAQPTRPDITESSTYQYGAIPASHGRQIRLDERILHDHRRPLYEPALANRGADTFRTARMGISGLPYRDCDSYGDRSRCFQKSNVIFAPDADSNQTRSNFGERKRKVVGRSDSIVLPSPTKELLAFLKTRGATEPA